MYFFIFIDFYFLVFGCSGPAIPVAIQDICSVASGGPLLRIAGGTFDLKWLFHFTNTLRKFRDEVFRMLC
jgi:hypothetical protein